jgi:hypothetical protein
MHIKNKPKVSSDRTMADLEEAVEQFKVSIWQREVKQVANWPIYYLCLYM